MCISTVSLGHHSKSKLVIKITVLKWNKKHQKTLIAAFYKVVL